MTDLRRFYCQSVARECPARYNGAIKELVAHKEDKTMYELDKAAFGRFLAQLRREKA